MCYCSFTMSIKCNAKNPEGFSLTLSCAYSRALETMQNYSGCVAKKCEIWTHSSTMSYSKIHSRIFAGEFHYKMQQNWSVSILEFSQKLRENVPLWRHWHRTSIPRQRVFSFIFTSFYFVDGQNGNSIFQEFQKMV